MIEDSRRAGVATVAAASTGCLFALGLVDGDFFARPVSYEGYFWFGEIVIPTRTPYTVKKNAERHPILYPQLPQTR